MILSQNVCLKRLRDFSMLALFETITSLVLSFVKYLLAIVQHINSPQRPLVGGGGGGGGDGVGEVVVMASYPSYRIINYHLY
uniref:Uncharacterized protein n=1 Tax=Glossina brevipalpis TaxID=37001 RepID=A0A1A9WHH0_9MUSC